jgi:tripartite-type tricarboxylate transporter receptor subunit TctC
MRPRRSLPARTARAAALAAGLVGALAAAVVQAQTWPAKPVRIIVPFGPGGSGDITARTFGQFLEAQTKQPVVIENRAGANGIIGTEAAKNATADGYTLLLTTNTTHAANVSLYRKLPYDPLRDFEHTGLFGTFGSVAVVTPESGIKSIADLVAFAKANPGKVFYGHYNSASMMSAELFRLRADVPMTGVAYKAIGNATTDLYGGQLQVIFFEYVSGSGPIASGKVIPLGVTGRERHKAWPNVPAIAETYPGFELVAYLGLAAPAGTPPAVVEAVTAWQARAVQDAGVRQAFDKLGMTTRPMTRAEYAAFVREEMERWARYVKAANIQPE